MATYQNGGVRSATANTVTAMKRSAETRRCPECGRKSALVMHHGEFVSVRYCRWEGCELTLRAALERRLDRERKATTPNGETPTIRRLRYELESLAPPAEEARSRG